MRARRLPPEAGRYAGSGDRHRNLHHSVLMSVKGRRSQWIQSENLKAGAGFSLHIFFGGRTNRVTNSPPEWTTERVFSARQLVGRKYLHALCLNQANR